MTDPVEEQPLRYLKPGRLEALTDGTLAIVITVLALLLEPPEAHETVGQLFPALLEMWHDIAAFAVTFVLVGIYWLQHHRIFHHLRTTDARLISLNLLFLLFAAIVPFVTGLVLEYPNLDLAVTLYGTTHLLASLVLYFLWRHVRTHPDLHHPEHHPDRARSLTRRLQTTPILYALAMLCAPFALILAKIIFVAAPLVYLAQGRYR